MVSKYDGYWQARLRALRRMLEQALLQGPSGRSEPTDIERVGENALQQLYT